MSIRNLEHLFRPRSIALIGASPHPRSVGAVIAQNLLQSGFEGPIMPVNPKHAAVGGVWAYPDVASLPTVPDLAVIATPPKTVPGLVRELGARGTRAVVIITTGFGETGESLGKELEAQVLEAAQPHLLRVIGPNCVGIAVPRSGLNAHFAHLRPNPGELAFVTQSGAVVTAVVDWAQGAGAGFSHLVSLGDMIDVDFGDMLDYLANDPHTKAILLYVEAVTHARKFMSAARAAARSKPVVIVKAGRSEEGSAAAASHTGALAGSDAVYDAVIRRSGMLRVHTLQELFDAAEILDTKSRPRGGRVAIVSNGGGMGVLATDALVAAGGVLAKLSDETKRKLSEVLPPTWSHGNPVDIIGDADGERYEKAIDALVEGEEIDALLVLNCPTGIASSDEAAKSIVAAAERHRGKVPIITSWVGDGHATVARTHFARADIPTYATPEQAVRSLMYLVDYRRNQENLMETPPSIAVGPSPDRSRARSIVDAAVARGNGWLSLSESLELIELYGIQAVPTRVASTPHEAAAIAAELATPVALKILSPAIVHKTDVGGVALGLLGPTAVAEAAASMLGRVPKSSEAPPPAFAVQPMVARPGAYELLLGMSLDPQFGPVITFGHGGTAVELIQDRALALPPLNLHLAREMMSQTQIYKRLEGYRGIPAANIDTLALNLLALAQMAIDFAEITAIDINPLLADEFGTLALDARVSVAPCEGSATTRLAIRPYPNELEQDVDLGNGRRLFLRPIVPEDEPSLRSTFASLTPEEIHLRFFVAMKTISHVTAARFTQLDYDREMAFVLTERGVPGETPIYGVTSLSADPDNDTAEFAIIVHHDMTGLGLGVMLLQTLIDYAKSRSIGSLYGDVLVENRNMRELAKSLGFQEKASPDDPHTLKISLAL